MPALPELQHEMMRRILRQEGAEGLPIEPAGPFTPEQRLQVYKNNTHATLRDLLKDSFPVTTILLGDKFMNFATKQFIEAFPPASGDMNAYGIDFPQFLANLPNLKEFPYVPDVAMLEWLAHEAYMSKRLPVLMPEQLAQAADPLTLKLHLQPHVHLLRSGWPVDELWGAISEQQADLSGQKITPQETFIAVFREDRKIAVWTLTEGGYVFLENLKTDPSFAGAATAAMTAEPGLVLDRLFAALLEQKLLAGIDPQQLV